MHLMSTAQTVQNSIGAVDHSGPISVDILTQYPIQNWRGFWISSTTISSEENWRR